MDGLKEQLKRSIRFRLSLWLSLAILVVSVVAGIFSFVGAYDEAHETQDDVLRQVASLLRHQRTVLVDTAGTADADPEARLFVQYLAETTTHRNPIGALALPSTLADGLQTVLLPHASYRVLVASGPEGVRIAVAQETATRNELAQASAMRTVLPLLVLVPILLLVVADIVRKLLQPVAHLAAEVEARAEGELHALPEQGLPSEVLPFVVAINRMLARVSAVLQGQRRFIADAAHELRSPMTALSLQAERLDATDLSTEARERLAALRRGIERGRALLEQLLVFAKVQSIDTATPASCAIRPVVRCVLEGLMPLAEAKNIDIGMEDDDSDAIVAINEADLSTILKNLIENAIRYTPTAGRVDIGVERAGAIAIVVVADSGPGIAPGERERVLQAFYRTLGSDQVGSGLGLAIVKTIVDRSGAQLRLGYADEKNSSGLRATVAIPLAGSSF